MAGTPREMAAGDAQQEHGPWGTWQGAPVFVLCTSRSGSTLLRFLLDAHPALACPPETNLPALAGQLATVWSLIEGAPLALERDDEPPVIPDAAIAGVRRTMDEITGSYLARRRKQRYCDKSLGGARFARLLLRIYPEARFLCLYRHPMDVIASGIEASPWGVKGYGFDPYVASTPGNAVGALARYWVDGVGAILAAEEELAESCYRVRYEDMAARPEDVAAGIFEFLGVDQQPGISRRCFSAARERFGPADYKIWHTSEISCKSVGRGWSVPAAMIPPSVIVTMRELSDKLGYLPVDEKWGTASLPDGRCLTSADGAVTGLSGMAAEPAADRALEAASAAEPPAGASTAPAEPMPEAALIAATLRAGLARVGEEFAARWDSISGELFALVATPSADAGGAVSRWLVDLAAKTAAVSPATPATQGAGGDDEETAWDIVGSADAWRAVLAGAVNLGVAMRRCDLRYCETGDGGPVAANVRIGMLADLLGLAAPWPADDQVVTPSAPALAHLPG
jgi:protein-tyrosine sulfotransferase